jgi:hypothetical protein
LTYNKEKLLVLAVMKSFAIMKVQDGH